MMFDANGNILTKSDVGSYSYHATKKRAVIQAGSTGYGYDANGNLTSRGGNSIGYTSDNLPSVIHAPGGNSSTLSYGAFRERYKQVAISGGVSETTITVAGLLERVSRGGVTEFRHRISGPTGTVAIYTRRSSGTADTRYLHRDHLGSPELVTDAGGLPLVKLSFGAYGERRGSSWMGGPSPADWSAIGSTPRDGFTGHEQLDAVGLIHMNGRVYDPRIGRFLSPDPFVDGALGSQGINRYGYVGNNPLAWVDPSGYCGFFCRDRDPDSDSDLRGDVTARSPIGVFDCVETQTGSPDPFAEHLELSWRQGVGALNLLGDARVTPGHSWLWPATHSSTPFGLDDQSQGAKRPEDPYSITVDGRELNPDRQVLGNPQVRENVGKLYENIVKEVGNSDFTFQVTGGDRYVDSAGNIRSSTTGEIVADASRTSPHLISRGARAVDLRIRGVSDAIVDRAIRGTAFLPANTVRGYRDLHTHVALPNRSEFYIWPRRSRWRMLLGGRGR